MGVSIKGAKERRGEAREDGATYYGAGERDQDGKVQLREQPESNTLKGRKEASQRRK